jgi:hypothetical protein
MTKKIESFASKNQPLARFPKVGFSEYYDKNKILNPLRKVILTTNP